MRVVCSVSGSCITSTNTPTVMGFVYFMVRPGSQLQLVVAFNKRQRNGVGVNVAANFAGLKNEVLKYKWNWVVVAVPMPAKVISHFWPALGRLG